MQDDTRTPAQKIRDAAHEVQRPVFFARGIIIPPICRSSRLQAVEGRLFKPMAWTVTFALIGALVFAILVAPVMAGIAVPQRRKGVEEPDDGVAHPRTIARRCARPSCTAMTRWDLCGPLSSSPSIYFRRADRFGVSAPSRRRLHLGARNIAAQRRPHGEHRLHQQGASRHGFLS